MFSFLIVVFCLIFYIAWQRRTASKRTPWNTLKYIEVPKAPSEPQSSLKGVLLGKNASGRAFILEKEDLNKHIALIGTTGSGKTNTVFCFMNYASTIGACIIIDSKGDVGFSHHVEAIVGRHGRNVRVFTIGGETC